MDNNKQIINKVKGLLLLANDNKNDEEGQSAFLMAQKLMIKYDIDRFDVADQTENIPIDRERVTVYKRLYWWERLLASIIADNFRVKSYYNSHYFGAPQVKRAIIFYGHGSDLELAKEMYILAYDAILVYAKRYVSAHRKLSAYTSASLKTSYIRGFLDGLSKRFSEQIAVLKGKYEVLVLVPADVERAFAEEQKSFGKPLNLTVPNTVIGDAYDQGHAEAKQIDLTKKTIDAE